MTGRASTAAAVRLLPVGPDGLDELARILHDVLSASLTSLRGIAARWLPGGDVRLPGRRFFRVGPDGAGTCYGGLEGDGPDLLLRSVAVPAAARGRGLGRAVVRALEAEAARLGAARLHLLTATAAGFFEGLGYRPAERAGAPPAIAATAQFASLCPASARYLVKPLPRA